MKANKKLLDEFSNQIPDLTKTIKAQVDWEQVKLNNSKQVKTAKKSFSLKLSLVSAFSLILICSVLLLPSVLKPNNTGNQPPITSKPYLVTIDVNPSIRLEVNENDIVTTQYGLNEDGIIFLYKENYVGSTIDQATTKIVDKLNENGFLLENDIKICVKGTDNTDYKDKHDKVKNHIKQHIDQNYQDVVLNDLTENVLTEIENNYKNNNIKQKEQEISEEYKTKIIEKAQEKLTKMQGLRLLLEIFKNQDGEFVIDLPLPIIQQINNFFDLYQDDDIHENFDHEHPTCNQMNTLCQELDNKIQEVTTALEKIEQGSNEQEYQDVLKDLYKLVENELIEEHKQNNKNQNKQPKNKDK